MTHSTPRRYFSRPFASPVGRLRLIASDTGLAAILWENDKPGRVPLANLVPDATATVMADGSEPHAHPILVETERQLGEYFAGTRTAFDLPLDPVGTEFQRRVWRALLTFPYGQTRSYADIARQVGSPAAVRAVGAANGKNPISIVTPCHRVIGSTGQLTGFAGGLENKAYLLRLESPQRGFVKEPYARSAA
jgi:methylated-DNA-[protein]-cysteine S-methyltransferase